MLKQTVGIILEFNVGMFYEVQNNTVKCVGYCGVLLCEYSKNI